MLAIRRSTYRHRPGFTISGRDTRGNHIKIFTLTRESAEHIKAKVKAGQEINVADFTFSK